MKKNQILQTLTLGLLAFAGTASAATKAGTDITNVATVTIGGQTIASNPVVATVLPRPDFNIVYTNGTDGTTATSALPDAYAKTRAPGQELVTPYNVLNNGNTDQTITLVANTMGSPAAPQSVQYFNDADGDGVLSTAERAAGPISSIFVPWDNPETPADEGLVHIIQVITVPGTATQGSQYAASPQGTGQGFDAANRVPVTQTEAALQYSRATVQFPAVAIGPVGAPTAPEGSDQDLQTKPFAVVGSTTCFDHTAQNTGSARDTFTIATNVTQGTANVSYFNLDGTSLVQPITLEPGGTVGVRVCYDLQATGALTGVVTITGTQGESNQTKDLIGAVEVQLSGKDLVKTAAVWRMIGTQRIDLPAGTSVQAGDYVQYTLSVHNPLSVPLHDAAISDALPPLVNYVESSNGGSVNGTPGAQVVKWNLGTLAAGSTTTVTVTTQVSTSAVDGNTLVNHFNLVTTDFPSSTFTSNDVTTGVWKEETALHIAKTVNKPEVTIGDRITYTLTISNNSKTAAIVDTDVTDMPPAGIEYIPGTSTLALPGQTAQTLADPVMQDGKMVWQNVATLAPQTSITITYQTRVTPLATGQLVNYVLVKGTGGASKTAIASSVSSATITAPRTLQFASLGDIVGLVYVDRNRNGIYDAQSDTPLGRARILLAGGREALTDASGRYSFANVPFGTQAVRLDPNSVPYQPLNTPRSNGLSGTQTVWVRGLTSADFPVAPLAGEIATERETVARFGDVSVTKSLRTIPGGYEVTLTVRTPRALNGVQLTDPLPQGATLKGGQNTLTGDLTSGETTMTYQFAWTGSPAAATTDPVLSWRN